MRATMSRAALVAALSLIVVMMFGASSALAASPWWLLTSGSRPAHLPSQPGETGEIFVTAENLGDAVLSGESGGEPVTIADTLPAGLEATAIAGSSPGGGPGVYGELSCSLVRLSCDFGGVLAPYETLEVRIAVKVKRGAQAGETNTVHASGGNAAASSWSRPVVLDDVPTPFGVEEFRTRFEEEGGATDSRAGSHPFQMTTIVGINQGPDAAPVEHGVRKPNVPSAGVAKDVFTKFPVGFLGDPTPIPVCSVGDFVHAAGYEREGGNPENNLCQPQSAVGVASVTIWEPAVLGYATFTVPLFAVETYFGEPARFGFDLPIADVPVLLDASLRSAPGEGAIPGESEDYGIDVNTTNISQTAGLLSARVTVWGDPGDARHDISRGWSCLFESRHIDHAPCQRSEVKNPPALLTLPTSCNAPLQASVEADSWSAPESLGDYLPSEETPALQNCNQLPFSPSLQSTPTTNSASSPSGLDVNIDFHDEGLTNEEGLAQSHLKDTVVTLPEGFTINPSAGVGLAGCTRADFARETIESLPGAGCPNESKLGTVEIQTPVLTQAIHGALYIAQPYENQFGSLVALYIVAKNPETGILIKLAGKVIPDLSTGQLVTTFQNTPQLPFSHFNFHFREGQQAPLITPPTCGTYTTQAQLTPWSEPATSLTDNASFRITSGVGGGPCPSGGVPPFKPGIESGLINNNAGSYSSFYLHLSRTDAEQEISGFSTDLPSGLTGNLTGIPFCPESDIEAARQKTGAAEETSPSCPAASQVGHTLVGTGVGAVLAYVPGKLYLAGPFHGAPFSLISITSAVVGPFDLGTVVLRFGLAIDPYTARVSVTPTSSEPIPTILKGIVTHVRDIRVYVDRPKFTLNPTSCNPLTIGSTLTSPGGASSTVTSPFQAANCQALAFMPIFKVSTSGKTSRKAGASLTVKLSYPAGAQANISKVKVDLPKQLPSRLTTLQKACTAAQFNANPAGCPAASRVGFAKAITPLIPVPLEGPAYFVSHGGEQFPDLIMVLQGYGVTIDLVGSTFINKAGITSSTFKTVPDQPVGSFELTLPQGPFSALAANGNLCKAKLTMPTAFDAQNGASVKQNTKITVTGCPKAKKTKHTKAKNKSKKPTKRRKGKRGK